MKILKNLIIVSFVFSFFIVGCKTNNNNSTGEDPKSNNKEQSSPKSDSKAELQNAFNKFRNVPFVTVKQFDNDNKLKQTEKFSSADSSFHRKKEEDGGEITIIGSETFSKENSNWEWRKESESRNTASKQFFFPYDWLAEHIPDFNITAAGEEIVEGKTAAVYSLTPPKTQEEVPSLIRIWVGKDNGLPLKRYNELKDKSMSWTETFDYETKFKIERPTVGKK